jgi:hypothetical protein
LNVRPGLRKADRDARDHALQMVYCDEGRVGYRLKRRFGTTNIG